MTETTPVHLVSLGCARNDVDSEELAARLEAGGFRLVDEAENAEAVLVNTCGFIEAAKLDSINTLMAAADLKEQGSARAVVAVGCMAERYGTELAEELPEADAVLGFDSYADIDERLRAILDGARPAAHVPRDRRTLLPLSPVDRQAAAQQQAAPPKESPEVTGSIANTGARVLRRRLGSGPMAPLKLASGCDRRCAFCAIPAFRGAYLSRRPEEIVAEARWLVDHGVREVFLVSENSSSYGKDLGDLRSLEKLLGELSAVEGLDWIRVSYLQPAETRPDLVKAICSTDKVVPYFDLSFQHASNPVLRRMRRFGDPDSFLGLIDQVRGLAPTAGIRSNVILGFPGETEQDVQVLSDFLSAARLDAIGVFGYSDEEGTEAAGMGDKVDPDEVEARRAAVADLAAELVDQRAEERIGESVRVLVEEIDEEGRLLGRAAHQGPEVDGCSELVGSSAAVGTFVSGTVVASEGVDLIVEVTR
ncbi:30S ribosomal protein S12 methylthiotransferase RimO [Enemella evansiae]|uniref:Ribosomal protein uS12 methylthiotransferase RimO n=1 Tax=Enemella evansiae TaxID=2016499 RepID=A0A255G0T3_9ACTN|nr:30S ribosomal protein S12 methylthiotransferase RimO [Enemella evansiae]PFG66914.1 ribosomal protein S12 methylthiotransferase RimO [Propionibacteriaceae bacterium ES.041]OYO00443.1 30S ribosomal protein S12 methylthiotransferase RimO [Enemella evansiae]OYO02767.1 30S ribosomal protein S12 methylthiotransferase RimO [Enemella evansiae]OYO05587.1 30S ribosomal protein S12 methylthiotransferase RimO [Enemella evansiae]OYO09540.1 30S ribosomal protein S12 methylthiotransferase RimO [Enemella e